MDVPWQRRRVPATDTTGAVLTVAATGEVVPCVLRVPTPGRPAREATTFIFEPVLAGPPATINNWLPNTGTAASSIVTSCSGAQAPTLTCWKATDGKLLFNNRSPGSSTDAGWDGKPAKGSATEWIEFDLGDAPHKIDRIGIYSVAKTDDPQFFPLHNPGNVAVFASFYIQTKIL